MSNSCPKVRKQVRTNIGGDTDLGSQDTVAKCADACLNTPGCTFFVYGKADRAGACFYEHTESQWCVEGWEHDSFDFYAITWGMGSVDYVPTETDMGCPESDRIQA